MVYVLVFSIAGVLHQTVVPDPMQVAGILAAIAGAEDRDLNIIAAAGFINGVQGLMNVAHKVDEKLERFDAVRA